MKKFLSVAIGAALVAFATPAAAQELVTNGGLETGVLTPFVLTPSGGTSNSWVDGSAPHSGAFNIKGFDNGPGFSDYAQTLTTTNGVSYTIRVWARSDSGAGNTLRLGLGAQNSAVFPLTTAYQQFTFTAVAASGSDAVHIYGATCGACGDYLIDDISVQAAVAPVPTLSEWAMIGLGLALAGAGAVYVVRRRYTV